MFLKDLNNDCLEQITKHLEIKDYINFSKVDKDVNNILQQDYLWEQLFKKEYSNVSKNYLLKRYYYYNLMLKINWKDTFNIFSRSDLLLKNIKSNYYSSKTFIINKNNFLYKN